MEDSTDPLAVSSGSMTIEILSGDPAKNAFALFPFYVAAGVGVITSYSIHYTKLYEGLLNFAFWISAVTQSGMSSSFFFTIANPL